MRTQEQQKIDDLQKKALDKVLAEAKKNIEAHKMKMHEISKLHAEALLKVGNVPVYGFTSSGFVLIPSISELTNFDQYFID